MQEGNWVTERLKLIIDKTQKTLDKCGTGMIPYQSEFGEYKEDKSKTDIAWWTNGFWGGWLWQLNQYNPSQSFEDAAIQNEVELDEAFLKYEGLHHDVGFMWLPTAVAHYRYNQDKKAYWRGRHAADILASRYNPEGKFLRSWNRDRSGWVIIDSMINIQLLFWASEVTNDPRYSQMANAHAYTVMNNHVRLDGSVSHIVVFDPQTGEKVRTETGQGYGPNSCWSRGQSWAIYGFSLAYHHTKKIEYLQTAKKTANYFLANVSQTNYVPVIDFKSPKKEGTDTSAASIAACGMLEIANYCTGSEAELYRNGAIRMLEILDRKYANYDIDFDGILNGATTAFHEEKGRNINLNYGDYYYIEALMRIINQYSLIW